MVTAQSRATVRGTMVRSPDGKSAPWLQVFADHPAVGNIMGWPREVLPVLQQPLCNLSVLAVATMLSDHSWVLATISCTWLSAGGLQICSTHLWDFFADLGGGVCQICYHSHVYPPPNPPPTHTP